MVSSPKFSFLIFSLFVSTFLISSSFAESDEEVWATARPEFRKRDNWCGTGTVYASIHEIQPISFGGIRLRGGTLFRLHGPHFELRSMFRKTFDNLDESFESSFPDDINNGQAIKLPLFSENFYESELGGRNIETEPIAETADMDIEIGKELQAAPLIADSESSDVIEGEIEGREMMARGANTEWNVDQNGVWLPKRNDEENFGEGSLEEAPEWERNFETEVVDPRNTLEELMMREQLRDEFMQLREKTANAYEGSMEARDLKYYWKPPSEETLTDILRYVLMVLIFVAAFILVALITSRRDVSDDETTVLVLNTPDHSTPLLQTYVVGDHSGDSVETGQMENGVVLYQPPEVGTEGKK